MQAARSVEHQDVEALQLRRLHRAAGDIDRLLPGDDRQRLYVGLRAKHGKLFLRIRAIDVQRRHQHLLALATTLPRRQPLGDLRRRGRLAGPLQADHHDDGGWRDAEFEFGRIRPQHLDQRIVDDLDDLLARRDRAQHVLADRGLGYLLDEITCDRQRDVGLEQGDPHLAHRPAHVRLGQRTTAAQPIEHTAKAITQAFEHSETFHPNRRSSSKRKRRRRTKPRRPA